MKRDTATLLCESTEGSVLYRYCSCCVHDWYPCSLITAVRTMLKFRSLIAVVQTGSISNGKVLRRDYLLPQLRKLCIDSSYPKDLLLSHSTNITEKIKSSTHLCCWPVREPWMTPSETLWSIVVQQGKVRLMFCENLAILLYINCTWCVAFVLCRYCFEG